MIRTWATSIGVFQPLLRQRLLCPVVHLRRTFISRQITALECRPGSRALDELKRIVPQIRQRWPQVQLVVRGDSAYSRNDIMSWCEARGLIMCLV